MGNTTSKNSSKESSTKVKSAGLLRKDMSVLEELKKKAAPARGTEETGFNVTTETLYQNKNTGSVVLKVLTDNADFIQQNGYGEHIVWGYFLAGNRDGYAESGCYVESEANFSIDGVKEDVERIVIKRSGSETIHFGIQVAVDDIVFKKSKLKPYNK